MTSEIARQARAKAPKAANPGTLVLNSSVDADSTSGGKKPPRPPIMATMPLAIPACFVKYAGTNLNTTPLPMPHAALIR